MALNAQVTPLTPFLLRKDKLFTYDEVVRIREGYGFSSKSQSLIIGLFRTLLKYFETKEIEMPTQAWLLYENEQKQVDNDIDVFRTLYPYASEYKVFEKYLIMLMACSRIPIDRDFISEVYIYNTRVGLGKNSGMIGVLMDEYYHRTKPDSFPNLYELKHQANRRFIFSLNAFYEVNDLTEETLVKEFLNAVSGDTYRKTGAIKIHNRYSKPKFLEFIEKIYPELVKTGAMERKDNIYEFLRSLIYKTPDDVKTLRNYLNNRSKELDGSEMQVLIHQFVESNIITINGKEELQKNISNLRSTIKNWCNLSLVAMDDGVEKIAEITAHHRDVWLNENKEVDGKRLLIFVPPVFKFYNEVILGKNSPFYYDVSIFSTKWSPNIGKDVIHTPLQGAAFGQVISALAQKILETRKEGFAKGVNEKIVSENLHTWEIQNFLYSFFIYRLIWFVLLTGRRLTEIRNLKLARVKNSLSSDDSYVYIKTAKGNHDKREDFERGQKCEDGSYEFDYAHIDIFKEVIKAAELVYKGTGIPIKDQYLFPSTIRNYSAISSTTIREYFMDLQKELDIVHGSPIDFKNKLMYESSPEWQKQLGKPLFSLHHLRHAFIHTIHANAHLPLAQVMMNLGHRNNKSIGEYTKILASVFQVFKILEDQGHVGAARELVSTFFNEIPKGIEGSNAYVVLKNFLDYLNEFKVETPLQTINSEANQFTEVDSECVTTISCGDTGMGCLKCNDFRAGRMTFMALFSVSTIFDKEFRNIDALIDQINKRKKEILKVNRKGDKRLKTIEMLFVPLIDRFKGFIEAKQITLLSMETGFGLTEKEADEMISKIWKRARKLNLDDDIVKYIKQSRKDGMFSEIDFTLYRTAANREVFMPR
ncbi:hypothetical protein M3610_13565 [Neobacillus sp. MER 74]|uniref:hypothetical protein n=1 Tax=Neobacillus sp. MER 74 TaxID=2939566 RepID=UPI002040185C|nr:hypothetical protein [Neobacillus sp. MER 74]MCM3116327.1 hypothetical protein [Neobacillus sp. MER 74]